MRVYERVYIVLGAHAAAGRRRQEMTAMGANAW